MRKKFLSSFKKVFRIYKFFAKKGQYQYLMEVGDIPDVQKKFNVVVLDCIASFKYSTEVGKEKDRSAFFVRTALQRLISNNSGKPAKENDFK